MTTANVTVGLAVDFRPIGPTGEGGKLGHEASMGIGHPFYCQIFF